MTDIEHPGEPGTTMTTQEYIAKLKADLADADERLNYERAEVAHLTDQLAGAVEALRDIQDVAFEGNGAAADTQRLATVLKLVNEALFRLGDVGHDAR